MTTPDVPRMARRLAKHVPATPPERTLRVLDFGGGDGSVGRSVADALLSRRNQERIEVDVVDYQAVGAYSTDRIAMAGFNDLGEITGPYDVVIGGAILPLTTVVPNLDLTFPAHVHDMGALFWNRVPQTFDMNVTYVFSRPSPVETSFRSNPFRSAAATLLKIPALLEGALFAGATRDPFWHLVGGWEVMLLLDATHSEG